MRNSCLTLLPSFETPCLVSHSSLSAIPALSNRPTGIAEANPALETQLADLWAAHIVRGWMLSFQGERVSAFSGSILSVALAIRHHSKRIWCFLQIIRMCTLDLWGVKGSGHLVVGIRMGFDVQ